MNRYTAKIQAMKNLYEQGPDFLYENSDFSQWEENYDLLVEEIKENNHVDPLTAIDVLDLLDHHEYSEARKLLEGETL